MQDASEKVLHVLERHSERVAEALEQFTALMDGERPKRRFIFVCGAPRTGGTYVTKAICSRYWIDIHQHAAVLHDGFPALATLADLPVPQRRIQMLWQWAQWLALTDTPVVVKKLHTLVYDREMADFLDAEVIGTIRDPDDALASLEERGAGDVERQVRSAVRRLGKPVDGRSLRDLWPDYWTDFYSRLRADRLLDFGPDMAAEWGGKGFITRP